MVSTKVILGVEVDAEDSYKASVYLSVKLAEMVINNELSEKVAKNALLDNFPGDKHAQSLEMFDRVLSGEKLPGTVMIKRPGESFIKCYWKEHKPVAIFAVILFAYIIFKDVL